MIFLMARIARGTREEKLERNWYQMSFSGTSFLLRVITMKCLWVLLQVLSTGMS